MNNIMPIDKDFISANFAIEELEKILSNQQHGERGEIANDIVEFVAKMKNKYTKDKN